MGGKTSTSFQIGNQVAKGKGRKGFVIEAKQYKEMLTMTNLYFSLLKKILKGKPTTEERMRFEDVRQAMGKIIDKLHANRTDITSGGEPLSFLPTPEEKERVDRALKDLE